MLPTDMCLCGPTSNQIYNHNFYWKSLSPTGGGKPTGPLYDAIIDGYGTYDNFVDEFDSVATSHFGSGWAWLVMHDNGTLSVSRSRPVIRDQGGMLLGPSLCVRTARDVVDMFPMNADCLGSRWPGLAELLQASWGRAAMHAVHCTP